MLKVDKEKILQDYCELVAEKDNNLSKIEADARAYALAHGYNEEKTQKFIAFVTQEIEGNGLSAEESAKLEILSSYIDEVEESIEEVVEREGYYNANEVPTAY